MVNKQETRKRRVAAANQMARQQAAAARAARRKQLIVGGVVGFLALALIAPLTAGLLLSDSDPQQPPVTTTTPVDVPWAAAQYAGATITGPTPCPATDGSAERTTEFTQAPPVCIEDGGVYNMTLATSAGSFILPLDSNVNATAANLAAVMGWYHAYEQTPVTATSGGLMIIGSGGDAGFTIPLAPPTDPIDELYPVGSVVALPGIDGGITGALVVVLDEAGSSLIRIDPRYIPVGVIDDLTDHRVVYDSADPEQFLLIDSVSVELAS